MFYLSCNKRARFKPYSLAVQTRFKWRHKENDRWRRLMDGSSFIVDWFSRTQGPTLGQNSGHWSHIITCAHVICPWDYPNYYSPDGPARYVTHITIADTLTQLRVMSIQGKAIEKHFVSNQHIYVHNNPRLDICALHAQQNFRRFGETRLLSWQNNGLVIYPRFELNEPLRVGDEVWIYGMHAHESLFEQQKMPQPLMIPIGVRGKVHTLSREHFFVTTIGVQREQYGQVQMGMCGSAIMRNGKCVGMLTAMVHRQSDCKELAGTAMCTYAQDIFQFLLQVEKQMKNPVPPLQSDKSETQFEQRRKSERKSGLITRKQLKYKTWQLDHSRLARHVGAPLSMWKYQYELFNGQNIDDQNFFGPTGMYNQEVQQNVLGYDLSSSTSNGTQPQKFCNQRNSQNRHSGQTSAHETKNDDNDSYDDVKPRNIYLQNDNFADVPTQQETMQNELLEQVQDVLTDEQRSKILSLRDSLKKIRKERAMSKMRQTAFQHMEKYANQYDASNTKCNQQTQFVDPQNSQGINHNTNNNQQNDTSFKQTVTVNDNYDDNNKSKTNCSISREVVNEKQKINDVGQAVDTYAKYYTKLNFDGCTTIQTNYSVRQEQIWQTDALTQEKRRRRQEILRKKQEGKGQEEKYRQQLRRDFKRENFSFDEDVIPKT